MGSAIATRLLDAGHELTVWNRTPERAEPLVGRGAGRGTSPSQAASAAEVVITSLSEDAAVRAVCLGDNGAVRGLRPDAILVDMSTVSPETSRMLAEAVSGRFVDAPILGAPAAVLEHQATLVVGGDPALLTRLAQLFEDLAARHIHCGPAGMGVTVKAVANLLLIGQLGVLAEAVATAQANGVSDDLLATLGRTPLVAPALHNRLDDVIHGDHSGWFTMRLGRKDLGLAHALGSHAGLQLELTETLERLFDRAIDAGFGDRDIAAVVEAVRARRTPVPR
jgi:3-hydroxyisobutyrate dehydrogenase-like beta-hydroxyacid dehydrogenase